MRVYHQTLKYCFEWTTEICGFDFDFYPPLINHSVKGRVASGEEMLDCRTKNARNDGALILTFVYSPLKEPLFNVGNKGFFREDV